MLAFARTIGIDYPAAETPTSSLTALRAYLAEGDAPLSCGCSERSPHRAPEISQRNQR